MDCQKAREYVSRLIHARAPGTRDGGAKLWQSALLTPSYRSDADADVLADYVLALLRHDGDIATVRRLCEEEIPDFLKEGKELYSAVPWTSLLTRASR